VNLLDTALTHTSYVKGDGKGAAHNERLEYLGDAVLELCITEELYHRYPAWSEGTMTRARASMVREEALCEAAKLYRLQKYILLGHGEERTGGRDKPSILSDVMESVIGAVYLDGGYDSAKAVILRFATPMLKSIAKSNAGKDDKSALQEYVQKKHLGNLGYKVAAATGPDHKKNFRLNVYLNDRLLGEGSGASKQEAGQCAARAALKWLRTQDQT
jgi:ribonuclease-3